MAKLPVVNSRRLIKVLYQEGFLEVRQVGSHKFFKHPDGRATSVPVHSGQDLGKGLLRKILNQIELSPERFQELLRK